MSRAKFKPGQAVEVLRDMQRTWEAATYVGRCQSIGRSFHRVKLATPKRIDSGTGIDIDADDPRGYLTDNDVLPAMRIRHPKAKP